MRIESVNGKWAFWAQIIIAAVIISVILQHSYWERPKKVINSDVLEYYQYLPATIVFGDVTAEFLDDNTVTECCFWVKKTELNRNVFKFTMGLAILNLPFFLIAHAYASLFGPDNLGYSSPYVLMLLVSSFFYLMLALWVLRKILRRYFSDKITALTLVLLVLASNLFFYTSLRSAVSHPYNFSLLVFFIYLTILWHEKQKWITSIGLGLIIGLASLIRPSNAIMILIFVLYNMYDVKTAKAKFNLFLSSFSKLFVLAVFVIVAWGPQLLYWYEVSGKLFYWSYSADDNFFFTNPNVLNGLFSYRNGWLLYSPIMIFSLVGITLLWKKAKEWSVAIALIIILNTYIITSWWCWWYVGFGNRAFIDSYALLAIPLACVIAFVLESNNKLIKVAFTLICAFFILLNGIQTFQARDAVLHFNSMSKDAYWYVFFNSKLKTELKYLLEHPDMDQAKQNNNVVTRVKKEELD